MDDSLKKQISNALRTAALSGKKPEEFLRTVYFITPRSRPDDETPVDLETAFPNEDDAMEAAAAKDESEPLAEGDEWIVAEATFIQVEDGSWARVPA